MTKKVGGLNAKNGEGYHVFKVPNGCRFSSMKMVDGYIRTHRLVMAAYLQRPLTEEEVVHHIDGNLDNNSIENLMLLEGQSEHVALHNKFRKGMKYNTKKEVIGNG